MIVSQIVQNGLELKCFPEKIPAQHSGNLQMQYVKDEKYKEYKVTGFYQSPCNNCTMLLNLDEDNIFNLGPDVFKKDGILRLSFCLYKDKELINIGTVCYKINKSLGGTNILPPSDPVWMELVYKEINEYFKEYDFNIVFATENEIDELLKEVFK